MCIELTDRLTEEQFDVINKFGLKTKLGFEFYKDRPDNLYVSNRTGGIHQFDLSTILTLATLSDKSTLGRTDG